MISIKTFTENEIIPFINDLAKLRINVFNSYPYLCEGDMEYEKDYLHTIANANGAMIAIAKDEGRVIGASTALPLCEETDNIKQPLITAGYNVNEVFYYGESVLLPEYRGKGIGVEFMKHRELKARNDGFKTAVFCGVIRPQDHPLKPDGYQPLDKFWQNRGFAKMNGVKCTMKWQDINETTETEKELQFWYKDLI